MYNPEMQEYLSQVTIHDISLLPDDEDCAYLLCMKGAVEKLIQFCSTVLIHGKEKLIETQDELSFQRMFERAMKFGDRVIGRIFTQLLYNLHDFFGYIHMVRFVNISNFTVIS